MGWHASCSQGRQICTSTRAQQLSAKSIHTGYVRAAWAEEGKKFIEELWKVKAHVQWRGADLGDKEMVQAKGNEEADEAAKKGADRHELNDNRMVEDANEIIGIATKVLMLAAKRLPLWPPCRCPDALRVGKLAHGRVPQPLEGQTVRQHRWGYVQGVWHCVVCSTMAMSAKSRKARR
eukprot:8030647-Heterocapsa_arctica.AAC.1